ncbi:MAG: hypothetical protein ACYS8W_00265 [Planctomycetota bacterium]
MFKLDPGEPGILRGAKATDATPRVFQQEQRNLARLTAEAAREGQVVTQRDVSLRMSKVGDVVAATGGETTVVSRPDTTPGIAPPRPELPMTNPRISESSSLSSALQDRSMELSLLHAVSTGSITQLVPTGGDDSFAPSSALRDVQHSLREYQFRRLFPRGETTVSKVHVDGEEVVVEEVPVTEANSPEIETFA